MSRQWIWPALGLTAVLLPLCLWVFPGSRSEPEWTGRSPEALEELKAGFDDLARQSWSDAVAHFERALELDPEMPIAKLELAQLYAVDDSERERLWQELDNMSIDELSPREQFLIGYWTHRQAGRAAEAEAVLEGYLAELGDDESDPHALSVLCNDRWERQRWDEAEVCYRRLISRHPNWVQAQSRLGLIAMAQGRFELADESFQTFRYIAPDQAAPHDSIGQLQAVLGQYEEAERSFERALEVKSDYCMAAQHLQRLYFMWGKWDRSAEMLERMESLETCDYLREWGVFCATRAWNAYVTGDSAAASQEFFEGGCLERRGGFDLLAYRLAVFQGDLQAADAMEKAIAGFISEKESAGFQGRRSYLESILFHSRAVRSYAQGDWKNACEMFEQADELSLFWGLERSRFKLYNLLHLMRCHERSGHPAAAMATRRKISAVNPRVVKDGWLSDLD